MMKRRWRTSMVMKRKMWRMWTRRRRGRRRRDKEVRWWCGEEGRHRWRECCRVHGDTDKEAKWRRMEGKRRGGRTGAIFKHYITLFVCNMYTSTFQWCACITLRVLCIFISSFFRSVSLFISSDKRCSIHKSIVKQKVLHFHGAISAFY